MNLEEFKQDYDWRAAFDEALGGGYCYSSDFKERPIDRVVDVFASSEGQNDGPDWKCVFKYADGRYGVLSAGCDYTGWD